jgi:hypothetical protein
MSTGRAIVANHVSDYANNAGLIEILQADGRGRMTDLFDNVVRETVHHNDSDRRLRRLAYAVNYSYLKQIDRTGAFAAQLFRRPVAQEHSHAPNEDVSAWQTTG